MQKRYSYVSVLTTDDYLPGLLVLFYSLKDTNPLYHFLLLITNNISNDTKLKLTVHEIHYKVIGDELMNPTDVDKNHRWFSTYSKLSVFNQIQFEKIVYLDVDMIILKNIDNLFNHQHMSATNAGGMLPRKASWTHINSGLFVAEPSSKLFKDMLSKIGKIEKLKSSGTRERPEYGSDQDFLNAYYPNWPNQKKLHLDHRYNVFHYHLKEYANLFGYSIKGGVSPVFIIHYASFLKPWMFNQEMIANLKKDPAKNFELEAIEIWQKKYKKILTK